jgi:hypothetical protein
VLALVRDIQKTRMPLMPRMGQLFPAPRRTAEPMVLDQATARRVVYALILHDTV